MEENITKTESLIFNYDFTEGDFEQINAKGIPLERINDQLSFFHNGIAKTKIIAPATLHNGILKLSEAECEGKIELFNKKKRHLMLEQFIPASGAASRMFDFLISFLNDFNFNTETINAYINKNKATNLSVFIAGMEKLPFYNQIITKLKEDHSNFNQWSQDQKIFHFVEYLIHVDYFDYANKPKAVLPFHVYKDRLVSPIEEHLKESFIYASSNEASNLHFTISPQHLPLFEEKLKEIKLQSPYKNKKINITFSYQDQKTDTLVVDKNNNPFRDENHKLVFRPGGHGALIENLNSLDSDIIFLKNIDNVIHTNTEKIGHYKLVLAGVLLELQEQIFNYLNKLDNKKLSDLEINEMILFIREKLNVQISLNNNSENGASIKAILKNHLNRPLRVCGMVKNEKEPGGGPYWVKDKNGNITLQIVEANQIDLKVKEQDLIFNQSTHFNPVDLVCGIKNYKGEKFDLKKFVDQESGFIVSKTKDGKKVNYYELPGLWNGSMSFWNTVFVEVPLFTFNPVKTVNDLIKPTHQPEI